MDQDKLFNTFLNDGEKFTSELGSILLKLERNPGDKELLNQAFRSAHSLKSEASFLKQNDIIDLTHKMESLFDRFRNSKNFMDSLIIDDLLLSVDRIKEILDFLKLKKESKTAPATKTEDLVHSILLEGTPLLSKFEKDLIIEAKTRGEKFFRLIFELEDNTPLKYAKAYLLISNLEQKVNVIRTIPSFGEENDDILFGKMSIYFTCNIKESEIYDAVNVDQVRSIKLVSLLYESFLDESDVIPIANVLNSEQIPVKLTISKLDQFANYVDEMKIQTYRLKRMKNSPGTRLDNDVSSQIDGLSELTSGLEQLVKDVSMITLEDSFINMERYVRDLSKELDKEALLELEGCDIKIERRAGEIISELVLHIIRNALDHGIEGPEERVSAGKNSAGKLKISANRDGDRLNITISDDGQGIDIERIREIAQFKGLINDGEEMDLLSILTHPGISTRDNPDTISGRGVGLDLVFQKIRQFEKGDLKIETAKNEGTSILISIPGGFTLSTFQLVRCGSIVLAIPDRSINSTIQTDQGLYDSNEEGFLLFNGNPVFTIDGRYLSTDKTPLEEYGLILKNLDSQGVFLVDEILFKKDIAEERLTLIIEENQYLYKVSTDNIHADFMYLNPAIITM
jgi:two-component system, chemotaxis family, sensor kinase CheA